MSDDERAREASAPRGLVPDVVCDVLSERHVPVAAAVLAAAFADNPCYAWMHPRERTRDRDLLAFFERNLRWRAHLGLTWVAHHGSELVGTLSLEPPGGVSRPLAEGLRHWVLPTVREQGVTCMARILRAEEEFKREYRRRVGGRRYVHVHAVAVRPNAQGRGVGATLLAASRAAMLMLAARESAPIVLSTQRAQNLPFYARAGFVRWGECVMGEGRGEEGFRCWTMGIEAARAREMAAGAPP